MSTEELYFGMGNLLPIVWVCLGVVIVTMLWLLLLYRRRPMRVYDSYMRQTGEEQAGEVEKLVRKLPEGGVTILIYVQDNAAGLAELLKKVWEQEVDPQGGGYEVVILNDGSAEDVKDVYNLLAPTHPNLRMTFVPHEAHNLSRRKLAISLGVKSARYENILLLTAECRLRSNMWLGLMAEPFAQGKEVVLGYGFISDLPGAMNRYDEVCTGVTWLSGALAGHPYRGVGYNLGYTRAKFLENKGFSRSMNLHHGDDDLFVNDIANSMNTSVMIAPEAQVAVVFRKPWKEFRNQRLSHLFTGRKLGMYSRIGMGAATLMMWIWLAATVVGIVFSLPNMLPGCVFLGLMPLLWIPLVIAWRKAGVALGVKLPKWRMPWLMMTRCFRNLRWRLRAGTASRKNYTWLQH